MKYVTVSSRNPGPIVTQETGSRTVAVLTSAEWDRLGWKLMEKQKHSDALNAMKEKEKLKMEQSRQMTKKWPNTVEQKHRQREQKLRDAAREKEERAIKEYEAIIEQKAKEREEAFERAKNLVYEMKDSSKTLVSGLVMSSVLEERQRQIQLKKAIENKKKENDAKEAAALKKLAEEYKDKLARDKIEEREKKLKNKEMLLEQLSEFEKRRHEQLEQQMRERDDNIHNDNELREMEEREKIDSMEKKKKLNAEEKMQKQFIKVRREQIEQEEREQNVLNAIYQDVKEKLEKRRRDTEVRIRKEEQERRAALAKLCVVENPEREEEESRLKALKEQEEKYEKEQRIQAEKKIKFREELIALERQAIAEQKARRKRDFEDKRWALLQRLALDESNKDWKLSEEQKKLCQQLQLRKILVEQWKDRYEQSSLEAEERAFYEKIKMAEKDELLKYCTEIEKYTSDRKWPMYPVSSAVRVVLKSEGIPEEKRKVPFLQSKVPIASIEVYEKTE